VPPRSRLTHGEVVSALLAPLLITALASVKVSAQATTSALLSVQVASQGQLLDGAEVRSEGKLAITDSAGVASLRLSAGSHEVRVWLIGYSVDTVSVDLEAARDTTVLVDLTQVAVEIAPVTVRATRIESLIEEQPERVEVLAREDVDEKALTRPGDMTNLLVEMGGIRMQPVAPGLGGASIRVQGLTGGYTLLLNDGLPLYGGHAPSLSLVQSPPLDLRQVEVIKGAATALYGPSALGGVVDLISRAPDDSREAVVSQTSRDGTDGLLWLTRQGSGGWGYTMLAGMHRQVRKDVSGDGWADLPGYRRAEARPRLFWSGHDGSSLLFTVGGTWERREGGTLPGATVPSGAAFPENLRTRHVDGGAVGRLDLSPGVTVGVRTSATGTWYDRTFGSSAERDRRATLFSEATLGLARARHQMVLGVAAQHDGFQTAPGATFDQSFTTLSLFASDTYAPSAPLTMSAAARLDRHNRYGTFFSPRASLLYHLTSRWSIRAAAGAGFLAPSLAGDETQEVGFARLAPGPPLEAERGESVSLDLDGRIGPLQMNATLFGVRVRHPVLPEPVSGDLTRFSLVNADGPIRSVGGELFALYAREPFLITATFSRTTATELSLEEGARIEVPLTPKSAGGIDVAWEEDEPGEAGVRMAVEVFYTGRQRVEDDPYRVFTPGFTTVEVLLSKRFGAITVFANGDDLTDVRQTRWDPILRPSPGLGGRWTTDEWAPLEGRTVSLGVRASF